MTDPTIYYTGRLENASNPYQGNTKKVLCVCSAGLLRSPTAAVVLSMEPFNFNTRAVGLYQDYALVPIDGVHIAWADEIVCMTKTIMEELVIEYETDDKKVICLDIPDSFAYRDPKLMNLIAERYTERVANVTHDEIH